MSRRKQQPPSPPAAPFNAAFERLRERLPAGALPDGPEAPEPVPSPAPPAPARAVVRLERKGRGGKEATIIELRRGQDADRSGLPPAELERWCRELKQALGCGGAVDGGMIVLQGDLRPRIAAALEARGVGRVTIG